MAIAVVLVLGVSALAGQTKPDDYVGRAMQLLRDLFPGLPAAQAVISDERNLIREPYPDVINPFTVSLSTPRAQAILRGESGPRPAKLVLSARFQFDFESHELWRLWLSGPFLRERVDALAKEVDEHPEWSDSQISVRLKAAGARFGPDNREEFLQALPLKELVPLTGALEVVSAEFIVRSHPVDEEKPEAFLNWRVAARWHSSDRKLEADRVLLFEPFEGALTNFSISSAPRPAGLKP